MRYECWLLESLTAATLAASGGTQWAVASPVLGVTDIMNRRSIIAATLAVLLIGVATIVAAQSQLPGSGWTTGFQFQNVGTAPTDVLLVAYDQNGVAYDCGVKNAVAGGSVNFLFDNDCPTPADFSGSAVIQSNEPTRGIVHVNNAPSGKAGGIYAGTTLEETANQIFFPLVKHNHFGRTTTFYVQNAQQTPVNITATFRVQGGTFTKQFNNVAPAAMVVVNPADAGVPGGNGQVGSLSVAASGPVAGTSLEHQHAVSAADNLQASKAFTPADYATTVYCPLFRNAHTGSGLTTGAQVQNVSNSTQTITLTYTPRDGGPQVTDSQQVAAGNSATFYAPFIGIPANSVGSATVTSGGNIVAVVNDEGRDGTLSRTTTYACFPASKATNKVLLPLYKEYWVGNMSGIQIQNVGSGNADITVTYIPTNKSGQVVFKPGALIAPSGSVTFFGVSDRISPATMTVVSGDPNLLDKTYGSVVIQSNQPIVAIANESGFGPGASNQDSKNYEGFNQ